MEAAPNKEDGDDDDDEDNVAATPNDEVDDEAPNPNDNIGLNWSAHLLEPYGITSRHLIESRGKLLMVRHHQQMYSPSFEYVTLGVEVLEADTIAGAWMPLTGGLGGGRALFISLNFSKCVAAPCGEVEEDVIYFDGHLRVFQPQVMYF